MQSLYKNGLEHLYDAMYQTFIDYEVEFQCYSGIIKQYQKSNVLEIGCGTGNLATFFIASDIDYLGLDISQDMINLSQSKNPSGSFVKGDVTGFKLPKPIDAMIITGRTTSYLFTNESLTKALQAMHTNLVDDGLLCFDFIDASRFVRDIKGGKTVKHEAHINNKHYLRESFLKENTAKDNIMFDWDAIYYEINKGHKTVIAKDKSTVRAFTKDEWALLLHLNNFELIEFIDRKSYAFDTYVVVAKKNPDISLQDA